MSCEIKKTQREKVKEKKHWYIFFFFSLGFRYQRENEKNWHVFCWDYVLAMDWGLVYYRVFTLGICLNAFIVNILLIILSTVIKIVVQKCSLFDHMVQGMGEFQFSRIVFSTIFEFKFETVLIFLSSVLHV